jgi:hypothetical protein
VGFDTVEHYRSPVYPDDCVPLFDESACDAAADAACCSGEDDTHDPSFLTGRLCVVLHDHVTVPDRLDTDLSTHWERRQSGVTA